MNPLTASQCRENSQGGLGETKNPKHKQSWEGRREGGVLAFHAQVRQGREEECFPLDPPSPGGAGLTPESTVLAGAPHPDPPGKAAALGRGEESSPPCSSSILGSSGNLHAQPGAVPRNLARAQAMLPSLSTQISLYLLAKWARGASSEADESRECEQRPQWLFVSGLSKAGEAAQVCFTRTKILPGAMTRGSEGQKIPSSL